MIKSFHKKAYHFEMNIAVYCFARNLFVLMNVLLWFINKLIHCK